MHIALKPVEARTLREGDRGESSAVVRERVERAARRAQERGQASFGLEAVLARTHPEALGLLESAVDALGLSVRAYVKSLRVASTIADLCESERIQPEHVAEAVQYRLLDRARTGARRVQPSEAHSKVESAEKREEP